MVSNWVALQLPERFATGLGGVKSIGQIPIHGEDAAVYWTVPVDVEAVVEDELLVELDPVALPVTVTVWVVVETAPVPVWVTVVVLVVSAPFGAV